MSVVFFPYIHIHINARHTPSLLISSLSLPPITNLQAFHAANNGTQIPLQGLHVHVGPLQVEMGISCQFEELSMRRCVCMCVCGYLLERGERERVKIATHGFSQVLHVIIYTLPPSFPNIYPSTTYLLLTQARPRGGRIFLQQLQLMNGPSRCRYIGGG